MDVAKDLYFVAVKVFLEDGQGNFLIIKDKFGDWDIPGGRLRGLDFEVPLKDVIKRKMSEELGGSIEYELREPVVFMRHERDEHLPDGSRSKRRIFAVGYQAKHKSGDLRLGESHESHEWVSVADFRPEKYFTGGWLRGVGEYLQLMR